MIRLVVTTAVQSRNDTRRFIQFPIDIDAETVADVYSILCQHGAIYGDRLNFEFVSVEGFETPRRVIRERVPQIVTCSGALVIGPCPYPIFEDGEVSADV